VSESSDGVLENSRQSRTKLREQFPSAGATEPRARAHALQNDSAKARTAYQNFFALWKDADPDIPVLAAAESEYAALR